MATNLLARSGPLARRAGTRPRRQRLPVRWAIISVVMWALALLFLLPFVWMVVSSLKREIDVFRLPVRWWPDPLTWQNYVKVWTGEHPLTRYIGNSLLVAVARVLGELLTASLAAYAFARLRFRGRNAVFLLYISTLIIPHQMLLVPRFILYRQMGIYDTLWALILPGIFTVFGTFLLRQFFMTIPRELSEAAVVDGAGELRIFGSIILPLAKAALATVALFAFLTSWGDFFGPLIYLNQTEQYTITLGLTFFQGEYTTQFGSLMAASTVTLIPVMVLFFLTQRTFIQGITLTGIKG